MIHSRIDVLQNLCEKSNIGPFSHLIFFILILIVIRARDKEINVVVGSCRWLVESYMNGIGIYYYVPIVVYIQVMCYFYYLYYRGIFLEEATYCPLTSNNNNNYNK